MAEAADLASDEYIHENKNLLISKKIVHIGN